MKEKLFKGPPMDDPQGTDDPRAMAYVTAGLFNLACNCNGRELGFAHHASRFGRVGAQRCTHNKHIRARRIGGEDTVTHTNGYRHGDGTGAI